MISPSAGELWGEARGKVILVGEHAVVYGAPAIVLGVGTAARARVRPAPEARLRLGEREVALAAGAHRGKLPLGAPEEARAYAALLDALGAPDLHAEVTLALPAGVGLGASAALAVALARAVDAAARGGDEGRAARVLAAAQAWENVFHGNASGVDAAAAYHGGCSWFTRAGGVEPLVPARPLRVGVAVAGPAASTRRMVEGVAERRRHEPERIDTIVASITTLVHAARAALTRGDEPALGALMVDNQRLLSELGVSTPELERAVAMALDAGAFGAKLTGGGGGGAVVALLSDESEQRVLAAWRRAGLFCFAAMT